MGHGNIILPSGPVVIVYKGWRRGKRKPGDDPDKPPPKERYPMEDIAVTSMESPSIGRISFSEESKENPGPKANSGVSRNFQFVNATKPLRNRDPDVRKLVRTHVMKEFGRDRRQQKRREKERRASTSDKSEDSKEDSPPIEMAIGPVLPKLEPVFSGAATPFYGIELPVEMKPHFPKLLNYYLTAIAHAVHPFEAHLSYNPVKTTWWKHAITDEVLLYTVLFASATHKALCIGEPDSKEASFLMKPTLHLLTKRLENPQLKLSDATVGAVACLAMTENIRGNNESWYIHMSGLSKMIAMRGGLEVIDDNLQMKIHRADLDGAVDCLVTPQLPPIERRHPPIYVSLPSSEKEKTNDSLTDVLASFGFNARLVSALRELVHFTQALNYAMDKREVMFHPRAFDEDIIVLQRQLLLHDEMEKKMEQACRLGALVYIKSIMREFPLCAVTSKVLVAKLKSSLDGMAFCRNPTVAPLLLWLFFMGGMASHGTSDRAWYVAHLVRLTLVVGELPTWEGVKGCLKKILWVDGIHERPCRMLWDEVDMTRTVLNGQML